MSHPGSKNFVAQAKPPPWMKVTFAILAVITLVVFILLWNQWEDAQADRENKLRELKAKDELSAKLQSRRDEMTEFLKRYSTDAEFRMRVARQRLNQVSAGEVILRLDPPPRPAPESEHDARSRP